MLEMWWHFPRLPELWRWETWNNNNNNSQRFPCNTKATFCCCFCLWKPTEHDRTIMEADETNSCRNLKPNPNDDCVQIAGKRPTPLNVATAHWIWLVSLPVWRTDWSETTWPSSLVHVFADVHDWLFLQIIFAIFYIFFDFLYSILKSCNVFYDDDDKGHKRKALVWWSFHLHSNICLVIKT